MLLEQLHQLIKSASAIPKTYSKIKHVRDACHNNKSLEKLLRLTLDPKIRFYLKSDSIKRFLSQKSKTSKLFKCQERDLIEVLEMLSSRKVTGDDAKNVVGSYLTTVPNEYHDLVLSVLDKKIYLRLSFDTIFSESFEEKHGDFHAKLKPALAHVYDDKRKKYFSDSLSDSSWYASRKFDGVRGLLFLTSSTPFSGRLFLSRSGKPFRAFPPEREHIIVSEVLKRHPNLFNHVLDGELVSSLSDSFQQSVAAVSAEARNEPLVFYVFDAICRDAFYRGSGDETFSARYQRIPALEIGDASLTIRKIDQVRVRSENDVLDQMVLSHQNGWEGIMLRKDVIYVGKRSKDLLKVKHFKDAEYRIIDVELAQMNLLLNNQRKNILAVKNIIIHYKGERLKIGSGLSVEERIQYAIDPSVIIGKDATVQFFSEFEPSVKTESNSDSPGLRFASIKKIWLEGKRSI